MGTYFVRRTFEVKKAHKKAIVVLEEDSNSSELCNNKETNKS